MAILLLGCSSKTVKPVVNCCNFDSNMVMDDEITTYKKLVNETFEIRKRGIKYAKFLKTKSPLDGKDIEIIRSFTIEHEHLRGKFYYYIQKYRCLDNENMVTNLSEKDKLKATMIALSSALILYDNYLLGTSMYVDDTRLRRLINSEDRGYAIDDGVLAKVSDNYFSKRNHRDTNRAIKFYKQLISKNPNIDDANILYLKKLIEESPTYQQHSAFGGRFWSELFLVKNRITDKLQNLKMSAYNFVTDKLFGGEEEASEKELWEKGKKEGKLYGDNKSLNYIKKHLRAGDIFLEKTPFLVTDSVIPGYWGHAAVYVGTEKELKALGIWNHPVVKKYHKKIRANKRIVEALRVGVQINSLKKFLDVDSFASLRVQNETKEQRAKRVVRTFRQLGKKYDFNFDIESSNRVMCSELVYITTTNVKWKTDTLLGVYTISPDHVALQSILENSQFKIMTLILDAKIIAQNKKSAMEKILDKEKLLGVKSKQNVMLLKKGEEDGSL